MKYLLDSNIISDFYDPLSVGHPQIYRCLTQLTVNDRVFVSILSLYELEYGFANAHEDYKPAIRRKIQETQQDFEILPLSHQGAQLFGELKKALQVKRSINKENMKKHTVDLIFATEALVHQCILVSEDKIYRDVQLLNPEFKYETWLK
jgi:predicted nucleic acid-binding protein